MNRRAVLGARGFLQVAYSVLPMPFLLPWGYKAFTYRGVGAALGRVAPVEKTTGSSASTPGRPLTRTRILIADDHEIFRKSLRSLVESASRWEVCGEATNGVEAVEGARKLAPDVIVIDVGMPYLNGLDATKQIRKELPHIRVLILSQYDSSPMLTAAIEAGASAYVTKAQSAHHLLAALEKIAAGGSFPSTDQGS